MEDLEGDILDELDRAKDKLALLTAAMELVHYQGSDSDELLEMIINGGHLICMDVHHAVKQTLKFYYEPKGARKKIGGNNDHKN